MYFEEGWKGQKLDTAKSCILGFFWTYKGSCRFALALKHTTIRHKKSNNWSLQR